MATGLEKFSFHSNPKEWDGPKNVQTTAQLYICRYSDNNALMAGNEEELKSLLMKVKEMSEKSGLKLNSDHRTGTSFWFSRRAVLKYV